MTESEAERFVRLRVLTPEQVILDELVDWAQIPLTDGLLGVWPGHAPLMAAVSEGMVTYAINGEVRQLPISAGFLRIDSARCMILSGALATFEPTERSVETLAVRLEEALLEHFTGDELEELGLDE